MDPGNATVECVEAGVRAALATAMIDGQRVALVGHSFGGYGTAFVLCKSKLFRAAVAASIFSDWSTFALRHGPGGAPALASLGFLSMPVPFWDDPEAYRANSVLYNAEGIDTPLLLVHGKRDDFCDWHEAQQLYDVLRYLGKPVTMLVYPDLGHGYGGPDYDRRVWAFLDHHLRDEPAEPWLEDVSKKSGPQMR
jgi:dipeptidyl aminopeptidase/acylaminoacyl peptidase